MTDVVEEPPAGIVIPPTRARSALIVLPTGTEVDPALQRLRSSAVFVSDAWTLHSHDDPNVVTTAEWLEDAVRQHRAALGRPWAVLVVEYIPRTRELQKRITQVQRSAVKIRQRRWSFRRAESDYRAQRDALIEDLSADRLLPSEIAEVTGLDRREVVAVVGTEEEARIARRLFRAAHRGTSSHIVTKNRSKKP